MKPKWKRKRCGCVIANLPSSGDRWTIRCEKHRGRKAKKGRKLAHFDSEGIVRHG